MSLTVGKHFKETGVCQICGKSFVGDSACKFCSVKCRKQAALIREKEKRADTRVSELVCPNCNKVFQRNGRQDYCSVKCRIESRNKRQGREYRIAVNKKSYQKLKDKRRAECKEYYQQNQEKLKVYKKIQGQNSRGAEGKGITLEEWESILKKHNRKCFYCNKLETPERSIEMDHVIPISRGGRHEVENVVPSCRSCNASKRNKTVEEWKGRVVS